MTDFQDPIKDTTPYLLGRIDGKIDQILQNQASHDKRISALERSEKNYIRDRGFVAGVAAVVGASFSHLIGWFSNNG